MQQDLKELMESFERMGFTQDQVSQALYDFYDSEPNATDFIMGTS